MKVGILTYHFGGNYGGVLQCLALQTAIESLGHEVEIINFQSNPRPMPAFWKGWNIHRHGFKGVPARIIQLRYSSDCLGKFDDFRKSRLRLTELTTNLQDLNQATAKYDAIVTGSDQVWNFRCSPAYFLALGDSFKGRKIAYAPCCTQEAQPASRTGEVGEWIKGYHAVSVRDGFSKRAVESASGREAVVVCDPTLLMDSAWPETTANRTEERILLYRLGPPISGNPRELVNRIKELHGGVPVEGIVSPFSTAHSCPEADIVSYTIAPLEWAAKIRHCKFLLTDSFHGVLFAMKYNIPFLAYYHDPERAPRLLDLRDRFGLHDCIVDNSSAALAALDVANRATPSLDTSQNQQFIKDSWSYLGNALS